MLVYQRVNNLQVHVLIVRSHIKTHGRQSSKAGFPRHSNGEELCASLQIELPLEYSKKCSACGVSAYSCSKLKHACRFPDVLFLGALLETLTESRAFKTEKMVNMM